MTDTQGAPRLAWERTSHNTKARAGTLTVSVTWASKDNYDIWMPLWGTTRVNVETEREAQLEAEARLREFFVSGLAALGAPAAAMIRADALREAAQLAQEFGECGHVSGPCNRGIAAQLEALAAQEGATE